MTKKHPLIDLWANSSNPVERRHAQFLAKNAKEMPSNPGYPSLAKQVKNAVVAAGKAISSGIARVGKDEQERRFEICRSCTEWFDSTKERCRHPQCGCYMRVKTWLATQQCPVGKWERVATNAK